MATVASTGRISVASGGVGILARGTEASVRSSGGIAVAGTGSGISVTASRITVETSGEVSAPGKDSNAIRTESDNSVSRLAPAHITINVDSGTVTGGSGSGAGILIIGGGANALTNFGTITTSAGLSGTAVLGQPSTPDPGSLRPALIGNNTVDNSGTVTGNVDLGPGRNAFNNLPGGTFSVFSSAYAFSIDDALSFKHVVADGIILTIAGTKGLEFDKKAGQTAPVATKIPATPAQIEAHCKLS